MNSNQYNLTEFQEATAERIFRIFHDEKQNRVLLADEVGLGKTLVARAVIDKVYHWHIDELKDDLFKVVYVCSNEVIARQNESKLGIPRDSQTSISENRLSMQHLLIAKQEADCSKSKTNCQLLPMTPSTSLDISNRFGNAKERALMFCILRDFSYFKNDSRKIGKLEKLLNYREVNSWDSLVYEYQKQIDSIHVVHKDKYPQNLYPELRQYLSEMSCYSQWRDYFQPNARISSELYALLLPELRRVFARLSISNLQPDLIIMDEFQRFNSLITCSEDSDLGILCHDFFNNKNKDKTKILLMSATPYKPYTTLAEAVEYHTSEHFEDFKSVFRFLYSDPDSHKNFKKFETIWKDYSNSLQELRQKDWSVLIAKKNQAEDELRSVLTRTERRNDRIIKTAAWEDNSNSMDISPGDVLSYYNVCKFTQLVNMERQRVGKKPLPSIPIEYAKSSPYLLSFMREQYKIHKILHENLASKHNKSVIPKDNTSFLNRSAINSYKDIPANNARLQKLYDTILPKDKNTELLLWVPPSCPYYSTAESKNIIGKAFDANKGFSKLLLFSAWEMVPRMTAAMTSYEAERRVYSKLHTKKYTYFDQDSSQLLVDSPKELLTHPSDFLADVYNPADFEGKSLSEILAEMQTRIQDKISGLTNKYQLVENKKTVAAQVLALVKALDGNSESKKAERLFVPAHAVEILSYMAVASPAVCAIRTLRQFDPGSISEDIHLIAQRLATGIAILFNRNNAQAIVRLGFQKNKNKSKTNYYYYNVLRYCAEGNFQAMLDEYAFVCVNADTFIQNMAPASDDDNDDNNERQLPYLLCTSRGSTKVDTRDSFLKRGSVRSKAQMSMRFNFAIGYYDIKSDQKVIRADAIRTAFNMPFRPFVLSTTSIGQEGLDFHAYCRKIMHWNLPNNPIDLEQREGRINRYMSLAIRQSLANSDYATGIPIQDYWKTLVEKVAEEDRRKNGGMVPYWILPEDFEFKYPIERIVPAYPYSKDQDKYNWIIKVLSMYRLTLGQPNQEELLRSLDNANIPEEQLKELFFNLSPFFGKQEKQTES
ncbi:MAG: DEAD/DEAH box helicase family protein [Thermoguttaceae bacterium]|nr:DEAD/DEAH box helicase family protein [Thermoguttaceae bacterium]